MAVTPSDPITLEIIQSSLRADRIAITQSRYHPDARAHLERKKAEGKSRREAIAASNDSSSASSSTPSRPAPP